MLAGVNSMRNRQSPKLFPTASRPFFELEHDILALQNDISHGLRITFSQREQILAQIYQHGEGLDTTDDEVKFSLFCIQF